MPNWESITVSQQIVGIFNEDSLKKTWSYIVSLQSNNLAFGESCWINAVSRSKYCDKANYCDNAKVVLMWVKRFLLLPLNTTGSKMIIEIGSNIFAFLTALDTIGFSVTFP